MKSTRKIITLAYEIRDEVSQGVWETNLLEKKVKATQERIFPTRLDSAKLEGFVISARFKIRSELVKGNLKYVAFDDRKYKVNNCYDDNITHFTVIELGELV